jgi:hypothetical protein
MNTLMDENTLMDQSRNKSILKPINPITDEYPDESSWYWMNTLTDRSSYG